MKPKDICFLRAPHLVSWLLSSALQCDFLFLLDPVTGSDVDATDKNSTNQIVDKLSE